MRCLVTGVAGFIGSHLAESLVAQGHTVIGVDAFIPYYPRTIKEQNLSELRQNPNFSFQELDLRTAPLQPLLDGIEVVFHEAATPGLLLSWQDFELYETCNILTTQRLLEACRQTKGQVTNSSNSSSKVILASTSSIYGADVTGPETTKAQPVSPYGITKLAGEHLALAYYHNFGIPVSILRYFSVYGPRQRPDMGYYRFIEAIAKDKVITVFGDGKQTRTNTYVTDIVRATILAARPADRPADEQFQVGEAFNIGGRDEINVLEVLQLLEELIGKKARIEWAASRPGEQSRTVANITKAQQMLGWEPRVGIKEGLAAQIAWQLG